jgi:hypothetical protein
LPTTQVNGQIDTQPDSVKEGDMHNASRVAGTAAMVALGGCASIIEGTSQQIEVATDPPGASCVFEREGLPIANIPQTPGAAFVKKNKHDITIKCNKPGYEDAALVNHSGMAGATFANVLGGVFMGPVAWAADSVSGADNKYDSTVNITLTPSTVQAAPLAPPVAAAPVTMKPIKD